MPIIFMRYMVERSYLPQVKAHVLSPIRRYNALLLDAVLIRRISRGGNLFAASVFGTRRVFESDTL